MKHPKSYDTTPEISKRMSKVGLKRNKPETLLAKTLWNRGYRYRLNYKKLPGSPDIVLAKYKIAIFVDGEFWHGKDFYTDKTKHNKEYWNEKIQENMARDLRNDKELKQSGWFPLHFWSNDVMKDVDGCVLEIENIIDEMKNVQDDLQISA